MYDDPYDPLDEPSPEWTALSYEQCPECRGQGEYLSRRASGRYDWFDCDYCDGEGFVPKIYDAHCRLYTHIKKRVASYKVGMASYLSWYFPTDVNRYPS